MPAIVPPEGHTEPVIGRAGKDSAIRYDKRELAAVRGRCLGHRDARSTGDSDGAGSGPVAVADLRRQHRRGVRTRLLHHPTAGAAPISAYRRPLLGTGLCGGLTTFHHAGGDPEDDRIAPLRSGAWLHTGQHHRRPAGGVRGHRPGTQSAGAGVNAVLWAGVLVIGAWAPVTRFMVDRAIARRAARSFRSARSSSTSPERCSSVS